MGRVRVKSDRSSQRPSPTTGRGGRSRWVDALCTLPLAIGAACVAYAWARPAPQPPPPARTPGGSTSTAAAGTSAGARVPPSSSQGLVGRWRRPDGGYILDVAEVGEDGSARVTYFNPRRVNVAQAKAGLRDGQAVLAVELRDEGYPGNRYELSLDAAGQRLAGMYIQPAERRRHEIYFERQAMP